MAVEIKIKKNFGDFSLHVDYSGEDSRIGILGASGCGKTMTLKCIAGIETPDEGRIIIGDRVFFDSEKKINLPVRERKIGYLFQNYALFPHMTVEQNIGIGISKKDTDKKETVNRLIDKFQLTGLEKRYPAELSGGQQQRTALARILACKPEMILLDEPFSALDGFLRETMQQEMQDILKNYDGNVLMVSHNRDEIYRFSTSLLVMSGGRCLVEGKTKEIFRNPVRKEAARLTGCKNIAEAKKTGEYEVWIEDWQMKLRTEKPVEDKIRYVGIRAHDLEEVKSDQKGQKEALQQENEFLMELSGETRAPFEKVYHLKRQGIEKVAKDLWWKKESKLELEEQEEIFPKWIKLPKERLLLLY